MKTHLTTEEAKTVLEALKDGNDIAGAIEIMEAEDVKGGELPALPEQGDNGYSTSTTGRSKMVKQHYSAHQMREYGEACARAALSAPANLDDVDLTAIIRSLGYTTNGQSYEIAERIKEKICKS